MLVPHAPNTGPWVPRRAHDLPPPPLARTCQSYVTITPREQGRGIATIQVGPLGSKASLRACHWATSKKEGPNTGRAASPVGHALLEVYHASVLQSRPSRFASTLSLRLPSPLLA